MCVLVMNVFLLIFIIRRENLRPKLKITLQVNVLRTGGQVFLQF